LGLGWLVAASNVVFRDIGHALPVLLNVGFWATPIVWPVSMLPVEFHWLVRWNPLWFVVSGYRDALISQEPAWPSADASVFYWFTALAVFCLGALVFSRFKAELADQI
jgi:lipopolysaccharide transport system permease protein/teichoic acid transport system permease protein